MNDTSLKTRFFFLAYISAMGGVYQGLGGMKPRTFRHSSMEGIAIITCSMVDEHLTIKVICS